MFLSCIDSVEVILSGMVLEKLLLWLCSIPLKTFKRLTSTKGNSSKIPSMPAPVCNRFQWMDVKYGQTMIISQSIIKSTKKTYD